MANKKNNHGVTPIIGTVLLLAMAIGLFSVLNVIVFSFPISPRSPSVALAGSIDNDNLIVIEHNGGEALPLDTYVIVTVGLDDYQVEISDIISEDDSDDSFWNIGERIVIDPVNDFDESVEINGEDVSITVVHVNTNSIIIR